MFSSGRHVSMILGAVLSVAASCSFAAPAWAGQVTNNGDDLNIDGTLRHEVVFAAPGEVITFNPGVNPSLTSNSTILIDNPMTIRGNGMDATRILGPIGQRVFKTDFPRVVTIEDLEIHGGNGGRGQSGGVGENGGPGGNGGAIFFNSGAFNVDSVRFRESFAGEGGTGADGLNNPGGDGTPGLNGGSGGDGGAIYVGGIGSLNVTNSIFIGNRAGVGGKPEPAATEAASAGTGVRAAPAAPADSAARSPMRRAARSRSTTPTSSTTTPAAAGWAPSAEAVTPTEPAERAATGGAAVRSMEATTRSRTPPSTATLRGMAERGPA